MAIKFGDSTPSNFYFGNSQVTALYQGSDLVWPAQPALIAYSAASAPIDQFALDYPFTIEWWQYKTSNIVRSGDVPNVVSLGFFGEIPAYTLEMDNPFGVMTIARARLESNSDIYASNAADAGNALNVWEHFALCGNSTGVFYWKNGVIMSAVSSPKPSLFPNSNNQYLTIGANSTSSINTGFPGYITNLRLVNGTCVYNPGGQLTPFTPPTSPLTAIAGTKLLLLATTSASQYTDSGPSARIPVSTIGTQWSSLSPYAGGVGGSIRFSA
jgi:hypothetical protein